MSEYTQIGLGMVGVMFFFGWTAFKMLESRSDRWHQVAALLLLFSGVIIGWTIMGVNVDLADDLISSHDISAPVGGAYLTTVVSGMLLFFYFALRIAFGTLQDAYKKVNSRGGGGDR